MPESDTPPSEPPSESTALIEIDVDQVINPKRVSIRANLVHVAAPVQNELQVILDCARLGMEAIDALATFTGRFPDSHFHVEPAENRRMALADLKEEARQWILRSAFQTAMELINSPLEQARRILALWDTKLRHDGGNEVRLDFEDGAAAFHKMPLEKKLEFLRNKFQFQIDPEAVAVVLSLHKARNCIVHRLGNVSDLDCDVNGVLRISWEEYAIFATKDKSDVSNARRVSFGDIVHEGEFAYMQRLNKVREFRPGEMIRMTGQDLAEICHTIHLFASQVRDDLRKRSLELGLPIQGPATEPRLGRR